MKDSKTGLLVHFDSELFAHCTLSLRKESIQISTAIEQEELDHFPKQRVNRSTKDLKERLINWCHARRDDTKKMQELLRGVAHTIRFS